MIDENGFEWVEVRSDASSCWHKRILVSRCSGGSVICVNGLQACESIAAGLRIVENASTCTWSCNQWREIPEEPEIKWMQSIDSRVYNDGKRILIKILSNGDALSVAHKDTIRVLNGCDTFTVVNWPSGTWKELKDPEMVPWDFEDYELGMQFRHLTGHAIHLLLSKYPRSEHLRIGTEIYNSEDVSDKFVLINPETGEETPLYKEKSQ